MISPADFVDHAFQATAALGILYTGVRAHLAAKNSKEAKQVARDMHSEVMDTNKQLKPSYGRTTAQTIEQVYDKLQQLAGKLEDIEVKVSNDIEEVLAEQASISAMFGAHLADGHDPIRQMSQRKNRRIDDPKEY